MNNFPADQIQPILLDYMINMLIMLAFLFIILALMATNDNKSAKRSQKILVNILDLLKVFMSKRK